MRYGILMSLLIMLCFIAPEKVTAVQAQKSQSTKNTPIETEILRATTKADFEKILLELWLISPVDSSANKNKVIDAAMHIPASKKLLVFYCVSKSAYGKIDNDVYFKIFSDLSREDIIELFEAVSLFIPSIKSQHDRQELYRNFQNVKKRSRVKLAKYIERIIPFDMEAKDRPYFIRSITRIDEEDLPEVIGRVMSVAKGLDDYGVADFIRIVSSIPKERRDFIFNEAKKLITPTMDTIGKAHLIDGLAELKPEDFSDIVALGKQLFFEDTPGGHRSLILTNTQKIEKGNRKLFVSQVKSLIKAEDPYMLRLDIMKTLAEFDEGDRTIFVSYLPPNISEEIKDKIFYHFRCVRLADMKKVLSDITEHLPKKPVSEELLLATILSSMQRVKLNR